MIFIKRKDLLDLMPRQRKTRRLLKRIRQWIVFILCCLITLVLLAGTAGYIGFAIFSRINKAVSVQDSPAIVIEALKNEAETLAAGYDYDGAIEKIEGFDSFENQVDLTALIEKYKTDKQSLVRFDTTKIPHIFFHSLIYDTALAFDGDYKEKGYNQYMVTISEFKKILSEMYNGGYVLVSIYDIAKETNDGNSTKFAAGEVYLPPDKKPFVLSVDDVCYYEYMSGDGFASRIVINEAGEPVCEYTDQDGAVLQGGYDIVPILEEFIAQNPGFSYKGARGILAVTGYDGVLGYKTCPGQEGFDPDDIEKARIVAEKLKARGWLFASHSWGHIDYGACSNDKLYTDAARWEEEVEPIVGETDILIYPNGGDISGMEGYSGYKYEVLRACGFKYFCHIDSVPHWVRIYDDYVRQARRNIDGYRMAYGPEMLSDLFDVKKVFDGSRPPVPEI